MKKLYILLTAFLLLFPLSGCTIEYSSVSTPETPKQEEETPIVSEPLIEENALFYPSTLNVTDPKITNYTYIDDNLVDKYTIFSAYYSEEYDTIYIAYDLINSPIQTLKAKDLYEIEMHAVNYFISDTTRSEDKNYLKAVRIYPDRLASSCRRGQSDDIANNINGCADYGGKEAIIDLNNTTSMADFYNEKRTQISPTEYKIHEPMRDTFAHEYGHISTFYHMVYKNDENYEDYLKLRLENYYDTLYPYGLPDNYSSGEYYNIQPEEILADDFVELFYKTDEKLEIDTAEYTFEYTDYRNSLKDTAASQIQYLKTNPQLKAQLKTYYEENFLDYTNKTAYDKPIIISSNSFSINYYESVSKIENETNLKTINSLIDVNLIAIGEATIDGTKYYRVILSNTFKCSVTTYEGKTYVSYDRKDVGEKIGYVEASLYTTNNTLKLYKVNDADKNNLFPIKENSENNLYVLPLYDFSYILSITNDPNEATMYDYLASDLINQTYKIQITNFLTLIE